MKLIFMGTPEFALPALSALLDAGHELVACYSQPPRPAGRGKKETPSPVEVFARSHGIPVETPVSLKDADVQKKYADYGAEATIVAAYGLLLPKPILEAPKHGCINIHPSLLPRWRGAAPIQRPIMAGDTETGCCIMQMEAGLDTGPVYAVEKIPLPLDTNAGQMHDQLSQLGAAMLLKVLKQLETGTAKPVPQTETGVTYAQKITKDESRLDITTPVQELHNHIRGLSPHPGAYALLEGEPLKILAAGFTSLRHDFPIGEIIDNGFTIACNGGLLHPLKVQKAGKRAMDIEEFLRGNPVEPGSLVR